MHYHNKITYKTVVHYVTYIGAIMFDLFMLSLALYNWQLNHLPWVVLRITHC